MRIIVMNMEDGDEELLLELMDSVSVHEGKIEVISSAAVPSVSFKGLTINCGKRQVFREDKEIRLTRLEYDVLYLLAAHAGQIVSKELIFKAVWGSASEDTIKVVANTVSNLRGKMEPNRHCPIYIKTVFGGYLFCDEMITDTPC